MELGLRETKELGDVLSPEGEQTVIASYWRVSSSHIKKSSRDVREWKVTQDLMFCPSAVVMGSFIKTSMTCSQTGGIEGGSGGCDKGGDVGRGPGRRCRGLWRGGRAKRRVRGHKATGGCGHDGGWELGVGAKPGGKFQKVFLGLVLEC